MIRRAAARFAGIARWLPAGIGLDDAIAVLAALAVLAIVLAMWQALRPKNAFERRLEQIVERKETLRRAALAARDAPAIPPAGRVDARGGDPPRSAALAACRAKRG